MDYCLVYLSSSAGLLSEDQVRNILSKSRINNQALSITGVLLYCNGSIIQVLEGDKQKVESLYDVISRDTRHTSLICLYSGQIEHRSFPDWQMGYRTLTNREFEHLNELMPFIRNPLSSKPDSNNIVMTVLQNFYKNNYRN